MTFTLQPLDKAEGSLLWAKMALSAFVGAVEPMIEPYPYVPYDPLVSDLCHTTLNIILMTLAETNVCSQSRANGVDSGILELYLDRAYHLESLPNGTSTCK